MEKSEVIKNRYSENIGLISLSFIFICIDFTAEYKIKTNYKLLKTKHGYMYQCPKDHITLF